MTLDGVTALDLLCSPPSEFFGWFCTTRRPWAPLSSTAFKHWRIKVEAISRLWTTCLQIVSQRTDDELAALRLPPNGTSRQRGENIGALRTLRAKYANAAQLASFEIKETDFEGIDAGDKCAPQHLTLTG